MTDTDHLLAMSILDSLQSQIAVVNDAGVIVYVNQAWIDFGEENGFPPGVAWVGQSYLGTCQVAAEHGDGEGGEILARITGVLSGRLASFTYEYPCHSPHEQRWFMMRVVPLVNMTGLFVVSHHLITERKLAEQRIEEQNRLLSELAATDKLTHLPNRVKLDEVLASEIERARRYGSLLSVAMVDVNHFKEVNDSHGHHAGDLVLASIAKVMRGQLRKSDIIGRWGGEEFLAIMLESDAASAGRLAEKLRRMVAAFDFHFIGHVTCSFGVAQFSGDESADDLVERADSALYQAKRNGRNRVEIGASVAPSDRG